jgi:hypothetical protein
MATIIFPETDDTVTVAAWASLVAAVNRGNEDPGDLGLYAGGKGQLKTQVNNLWGSTTYQAVFDDIAIAAGSQWLVEVYFEGQIQTDDPPNDASRLRVTAPAGGTWQGIILTAEAPGGGGTASGKFFSVSNGRK